MKQRPLRVFLENVYYGEIGRGSSNRNIMYRNTSSGNAILFYVSGGSTVVNSLSSGAPSQVNTNVVTAYAYKENDFGVFASGGYSSTDTSGNVTDNATSFTIGMNNINNGEHLNGTIKRLSYYNKRLSLPTAGSHLSINKDIRSIISNA